MSSMAAWSYTAEITIWKTNFDEYSQPTYGTPYLISGSWALGGMAQIDKNGVQFVPASTYFFEAVEGSSLIPKPEDFILRGDFTGQATPPDDAEKIKKVAGWDVSAFGANEIPDWAIYT